MQTIDLDICRYAATQSICAKQGDVGRKFRVQVKDCDADFEIPTDAKLSVWYSGTSGEGNYSQIGEESAFSVEGNVVTVELIAQMLTNKGGGTLCLIINKADGSQLGMWSIPYFVEAVPGLDSQAAQQYFTALSETAAKALEGAQRAETAAGYFDGSILPIEHGGTGAASAAGAIYALGAMSNTLVETRYAISSTGLNLDETLSYIYRQMKNDTNKIVAFIRNVALDASNLTRFSLGGGTNWMVMITRVNEKYGSITAWQYGSDYTVIKTRSLYNAVWGPWKNQTPNLAEESWVELWKNADPTYTKFPKQIIQNSNFSKYKTLYVLFRHSNGFGYTGYEPVVTGMAVRIYPAATLGTNSVAETFRYFNRTDVDKISFQSGYKNGSVDESACVPVAIYGVRY